MPIVTGPGIQSFSNLKMTSPFELIAGATILIPAGRVLVAIYSGAGSFDDIRIQIQSADGWEDFYDTGNSVAWAPNPGTFSNVIGMLISDGVNYRIENSGVNPVAGIQYIYMEI